MVGEIPGRRTEAELSAMAAAEQARLKLLSDYLFCSEKMRQLQDNLNRMEREGTQLSPPLDSVSPENAGKTQYGIEKAILIEYTIKRDKLGL